MAKTGKLTPTAVTGPAWKTKWPRNGDLKTWLRAMLQKCDAIADDDAAATQAHLPIEHLADLGCEKEALRHVDRYLRRLPRQKVLATVRMAELGAKISLSSGNITRMAKYLAIAEATEPFNTRKYDRGFSLDSVREFRAENGLLDPEEAENEEQRLTARVERAARRFKLAMDAGDREPANAAVSEMATIAREVEEDWRRRTYLQRVVKCYADLGEVQAVKRCLRGLSKGERQTVLDASTLLRLGMKTEAVAQTRRDIDRVLSVLREMTDPNIHHPVMSIGRSLEFLVEQGAQAEARRLLHRTIKEMPTWPVVEVGWTTSAVYHALADATAKIDGPAAAEKLLNQAAADGATEKRRDFRRGAVNAALGLKAQIGNIEEAIEEARKLRSPIQRRKELAKLLAKAQRWGELRQVLSQVESPEEAAEAVWWLKFELPGGEVR